jgi:alkylhydroperoxidase family enzyme
MTPRTIVDAESPSLEAVEAADGIGSDLRSLVRAYISYLSGCDACVVESLRAARAQDGDPLRFHLLSSWRRAPLRMFTERERVALVWAEVVAVSGEAEIGEALRGEISEQFTADERAALTRSVTASRGYARLVRERGGAVPRERRRAGPCGSRERCELCASP